MTQSKLRPVVVTTQHKGVFFGYTSDAPDAVTITLERCRMAVKWTATSRGVLGLCAMGPDENCKISHATPRVCLRNITAVWDVSDDCAAAWEAAPWS